MMGRKILAITSGGGHWEQMAIIAAAFDDLDTCYATTVPGLTAKSGLGDGHVIRDCNRDRPMDVLACLGDCIALIRDLRPAIVISTGAAPGLIALAVGKVFGAKAVWIDSVANSERLSLSGRLAGLFADLQLTQWQHLSNGKRPAFMGTIL